MAEEKKPGEVVYIDGRAGVLWLLEELAERVKAGEITCMVVVGVRNDGASVDYRAGTLDSADQLLGVLARYQVRLALAIDEQTRAASRS